MQCLRLERQGGEWTVTNSQLEAGKIRTPNGVALTQPPAPGAIRSASHLRELMAVWGPA